MARRRRSSPVTVVETPPTMADLAAEAHARIAAREPVPAFALPSVVDVIVERNFHSAIRGEETRAILIRGYSSQVAGCGPDGWSALAAAFANFLERERIKNTDRGAHVTRKASIAAAVAPVSFQQRLDALVDRLATTIVERVESRVLERVGELAGVSSPPARTPAPVLEERAPSSSRIAEPTAPGRERSPAAKQGRVVATRGRSIPEALDRLSGASRPKGACSKCNKLGHNARSCGRAPKGPSRKSKLTDAEDSMRASALMLRPEPGAKVVGQVPNAGVKAWQGGETPTSSPIAQSPPCPPGHAATAAQVGTLFAADDAWGSILSTAAAPAAAPPPAVPEAPIEDTSTAVIWCSRCRRPGHGPIACLAELAPSPPPAGHAAPALPARPDPLLTVLEQLDDRPVDPGLGFTPCRIEGCRNDELHKPGFACRGIAQAYKGPRSMKALRAARLAESKVAGGGSLAMTSSTFDVEADRREELLALTELHLSARSMADFETAQIESMEDRLSRRAEPPYQPERVAA